MKVDFEITDTPKGEQKKYPTAYLEGVLKIFVGNVVFFNQPGILLIELAIFIKKWLRNIEKGEIVDFTYESMDNDEPILFINHVKDNCYRIQSVWQEVEVSELLSKEDIVVEFEKYLDNLDDALKLRMGIELSSILKDSQL